MVLVIDNYDSFTYNLVQYLAESGAQVVVHRNDELTVTQIENSRPERILISPGPCTPNEAGICLDLIRKLAGRVPILGVCLGHQAIGAAFGGRVVRARNLMHGKASVITHDGDSIFSHVPSPFMAARYHSLIVDEASLPKDLAITARTTDADGTSVIMGLRHKRLRVEGVQFHPESVLTEYGKQMIENFLRM